LSDMSTQQLTTRGLADHEVEASRAAHGRNVLTQEQQNGFLLSLFNLFKEPMFLLLLAASAIYFVSGKAGDGIFMVAAIVLVAAISLYQESRSRNALQALKNLTQPECKVVRNGVISQIKTEEIVIGDALVVEEGSSIPADGRIIQSNDFSVNESMLTGESLPVVKTAGGSDNLLYQGTAVVSGLAICTVEAIGNNTKLGKIGSSISEIKEEDTPLQQQVAHFVKLMAITGGIVFVIVWAINYFHSRDILDSLLKALTLAMSIIPEEIPVAFTTFIALGAWRLMKLGIIVKQTKTVETLGSATVICTDKTGTITENKMALAKLYVFGKNSIVTLSDRLADDEKKLIRLAMWSSEPVPFDPMEVALHKEYCKHNLTDERADYQMVHEYPLGGKPPMMTHIFENGSGHRIIAAKGAPEAMIKVSGLSAAEKEMVTAAAYSLSMEGYRVLGVGETEFAGDDFPEHQHQLKFVFKGLVAFYDPPKENIRSVFEGFYNAGINVKIITGDNAATTETIASQIGFHGAEHALNGDELMAMSDAELEENVIRINIFTRMFPEAKLKIIHALKAKGQVVAMTGDGVNDGPALKAAHIGIAMGSKGTETAKQASSMILVSDDLAKMVDAVAMGRKIYANLKKAIQYIISIHIPIILTVFIPLALGWVYPNIFSPVHIIFFELIMGPTCSIIYENEPMEKNAMLQKPRPLASTFFNWKELTTSLIQGVFIAAGVLLMYQIAVYNGSSEALTRTAVFITLITANIFLTLVNRSFYYSVITTMGYKNNLVFIIIGVTILISVLLVFIAPLSAFFQFEMPGLALIGTSVGIGFVSVIWYEGVKWWKRRSAL
jgi:P-type Ca2+ transporter type 2C